MKAKRLIVLTMLLALLVCAFGVQAAAETASTEVYVTIANGTLAVTQEKIAVTDADGDGALTVSDALYLAHEAKYSGGAAAGYAFAEGDFGPMITKLWGVENGGSYGYYVNNKMAMSLTDEIKNGDYINAYVFTDTAALSDVYCYFDMNTADADEGGSIELTLSAVGFDADFNPVAEPVKGAEITINGTATGVKTDDNGKATITLDNAGEAVISAVSASRTLVPPVCVASVESAGLSGVWYIVIIAAVLCVIAAVVLVSKKKK